MIDETKTAAAPLPTLEDWQHWTNVMGQNCGQVGAPPSPAAVASAA